MQAWPCHKLIVMPAAVCSLDKLIACYQSIAESFPTDDGRRVIVQVVKGLLELYCHGSISHVSRLLNLFLPVTCEWTC